MNYEEVHTLSFHTGEIMVFSEEELNSAHDEAKKLLKKKGIVGCGAGDQVVRVFIENNEARKLVPEKINDVPTLVIVVGKFFAN